LQIYGGAIIDFGSLTAEGNSQFDALVKDSYGVLSWSLVCQNPAAITLVGPQSCVDPTVGFIKIAGERLNLLKLQPDIKSMAHLGDHTFQLKRGLLTPEPTPGFKVRILPNCSSKMWQPLSFDPTKLEAFISVESNFKIPILFEVISGTSWSDFCLFTPTITIVHAEAPAPTFIS